jgi:hypothetical protein
MVTELVTDGDGVVVVTVLVGVTVTLLEDVGVEDTEGAQVTLEEQVMLAVCVDVDVFEAVLLPVGLAVTLLELVDVCDIVTDAVADGDSERVVVCVLDAVTLGLGDGDCHCTNPTERGGSLSPTMTVFPYPNCPSAPNPQQLKLKLSAINAHVCEVPHAIRRAGGKSINPAVEGTVLSPIVMLLPYPSCPTRLLPQQTMLPFVPTTQV